MRNQFITAIATHQAAFGLNLADEQIERLARYYELIQEHNEFLHLVAPMPAEEFAIHHILESLTLLEHLPNGAKFADVGTGAGLPSIPCLLVRGDLRAVLIESKLKKVGFLQIVLAKCELQKRAEILNRQFSELEKPDVSHVTCRALNKFTAKLPQLIQWSGNCTLLFFGGPTLRTAFIRNGFDVMEELMLMSDRRFLFVREVQRNADKST